MRNMFSCVKAHWVALKSESATGFNQRVVQLCSSHVSTEFSSGWFIEKDPAENTSFHAHHHLHSRIKRRHALFHYIVWTLILSVVVFIFILSVKKYVLNAILQLCTKGLRSVRTKWQRQRNLNTFHLLRFIRSVTTFQKKKKKVSSIVC